jgi:hypothetical protein
MVAVAHASPEVRRLVAVRTRPVLAAVPGVRVPASVYRRRRALALLVVVTGVAALVLVLHGLLVPFGGGPLTASERPGAVYVVQPGDTFWALATRMSPNEDPRPLVARMVAAHGSPVLVPGERLSLPVAG